MTFGEPPRNRILRVIWRAGIRPRFRMRELSLLAAVVLTLGMGWVSLASTRAGGFSVGRPGPLLVYLGALLAVHVAFVISGRRMDQVLLPAVGLLGGLSLLLMARLPGKLVTRTVAGVRLDLLDLQLLWLLLGLAVLGAVAVLLRRDGWLRDYKYTWAAAGIGLLLLVFVLGDETNGARLSIALGPLTGQPSELLKVVLVIFLAAYLADGRSLLAARSTRVGFLRLPPLPYLLPLRDVGPRDRGRRGPEGPRRGVPVLRGVPGAAVHRDAARHLCSRGWRCSSGPRRSSCSSTRTSGCASTCGSTRPPTRWAAASRRCARCTRSGAAGSWVRASAPACRRWAAARRSRRSTDFAFAALGEELGLAGASPSAPCS
ncbi:MAG: FtsW/RodA/SpoVE family cell cycle protein [Chloroflexota bacterium]